MFATQTPALAGRRAKAQIKNQINNRSKAQIKINSRAGLARQPKVLW